MAIFGRKPWVNPFGKISIFRLFELLVLYSLERRFFVLECPKTHLPGLYCRKNKVGKMAIFSHAVHGSFTVKDDCERQFWNGPFLELKERINNRCSTWAINNLNLWAKYYANWWHYGWRLDCKLLYWSEQLSRWMSDESWFLRFRRKVSPELRERIANFLLLDLEIA